MSAVDPQVVDPQEFIDILDYNLLGDNATLERKRTFIQLYREHGSIFHAAKLTPVNRKTVYRWLESDPQFAEALNDCKEDCSDQVETSVFRKAINGDTISAIFYLKAHRPKFRDRVTIDLDGIQDEINERLERLGLRELPALVTTTLDDSGGDNHSATELESTRTPQFPSLPDSEQKD